MKTIQFLIGRIEVTPSGTMQDNTRKVELEGEELATLALYKEDPDGRLNKRRGVNETLCRTEDGRLIVHSEDWSTLQDEPTVYELVEITKDDLLPGGRFDRLGERAGYGHPLTLDEALGL